MTESVRAQIEIGPKGKRVVAVALDWPGLSRGAKTESAAIEHLQSYLPRYASVAKLAGMAKEFDTDASVEVVDRYTGTGSTDFWGVSFAFSDHDRQTMTNPELERELTLMQACWSFFDGVRGRVSEVLQKGPRGGGRDRDQIVNHTLENERQWAPKISGITPQGAILTDEGLRTHRENYVAAIRDLHARGEMAGKWPLRYLIRHTAYHTMDHAWEMEDKDLSDRAS